MSASLNKVVILESNGFRRLSNLEQKIRYEILDSEKIPMCFRKNFLNVEGFGRVLYRKG